MHVSFPVWQKTTLRQDQVCAVYSQPFTWWAFFTAKKPMTWCVDYCCIGVTYPVWACTGTEYIKVTRERQAVTAHSRNVWAPISLFEHSAAKIQAAATAKIAMPLRCYMYIVFLSPRFYMLRTYTIDYARWRAEVLNSGKGEEIILPEGYLWSMLRLRHFVYKPRATEPTDTKVFTTIIRGKNYSTFPGQSPNPSPNPRFAWL